MDEKLDLPNGDQFFDDKKKRLMIYGRRSKTYFIQKYVPPVVDGEQQLAVLPENEESSY